MVILVFRFNRAEADTVLCPTCVYEQDDTCTFPQRPDASTCTLYRDHRKPRATSRQERRKLRQHSSNSRSLLWLLGVISIIGVAILLAR